MALEKLTKYQDVLKQHIVYIEETDPEDKKEKKHLEKIKKAISLILEGLDSDELAQLEEAQASAAKAEETIKSLEEQLAQAREKGEEAAVPEGDGVSREEIEKSLRDELEKEYGELIEELEKENEELTKSLEAGSEGASDDGALAAKEEEIAALNAQIAELKAAAERGEGDSEMDPEQIKQDLRKEIRKEFKKEIASLKETIEKLTAEGGKQAASEPAEEAIAAGEPARKPDDYRDIQGWEAYLEENHEDKEAREAILNLEKEAREEGNFKLLSEVLIVRFDFGMFESEQAGVALIREVSRINEIELGDMQNAFNTLKMLFDEYPENEELLADLQRIAAEGNIWSFYVEELTQTIHKIENEVDEKILAKLWFAVARAYNERLNQPVQAIAALDNALAEDRTMGEALDEKATILKQQEEWDELLKTLEARLKLSTDPDEKAFYLKEMGSIKERRLGEPIMAARTYEEVFTVVPDDIETISALEAIYREHDLYEPLAALLQRKIESVDNPEDARIARRDLGFLYAKELDDHNRAIDILEHLVEVLDKDIKLHRVLAELYEGAGRTRSYLKTANHLAELTEVEGEKINLYKRIATELQLSATTRVKAAEAYEKVLEIRPSEEDVYGALEDLYEAEELYEELTGVLTRHIEVVDAKSTKATLLRKLGEVYLKDLDDPEAALPPLEESFALKGKNVDTMKLLTKALYRLEEYEKNVPILEKLAEKLEGEERREVLEWLGFSLMKMNDIDKAEESLHKSLAINEDSFICLSALGEIYGIKEQWTRAVSYYQRALKATSNKLDQGEIVFRAASILSDNLGDQEKAVELYEELLEISPGHPKAVRVLTDYYVKHEQWEKAAPLLHIITTEAGSMSKSEQVALFIKAGRIALAIDEVDKAADYLEKARELEPTSLQVLLELAELRYRREEWDGALSLYQALLVAHRDAISKDKIAEIYTRLGSIKETKGDTLKAISFYDKALEVNPQYGAAAEAVLKLREDNEDYETVAKIKMSKIESEKDEEKKLEMMSELVRFYIDTVKDPEAAIALQEKAIEMRPDDRGILNDSLDLYHLCERWEKVSATVLRLAELEEPGLLRSKYHYSAGLIFLEEVGDDDKALEQFNLCLDHDAENEEVFEKILEVHEMREDWHSMVKAIRRQLKRDPNSRANIALWDKLGSIYQNEMGDYPTAIAAFEAAAKLEPTEARRQNLAKIYVEAGPDYYDKAEGAMMDILQIEPQNVPLIRNVLELAKIQQEKDKVWGLCGALSLYKQADPKEELYFKKYSFDELRHARSILTDDLWLKLQSPEESHDLNTILAGLGHQLSIYYAVPHKDFGISRSQAINIDKDQRPFVKAYEYVSKTLLIKKRPELYGREGLPIAIQLANTKEKESLIPSWFIEEKRFNKMDQLEAAFYFARELPFLRPERLFRREAPAPINLMDAIYASFHVLVPDKAPPMPKGRESEIKKLIQHITQFVAAATIESLKQPAARFVSTGFENSVKRWIAANHKTSIRAATLITGDLKHTIAWVLAEQDNVTGMLARDRVAEVMRFVLSKEYYELRERLGLGIA